MQRRRFLEFAGRLGAGLGIAGPLLGPQSLEALPNTDTAKRKSVQRTKGKKAPAPTALLDGEWLLATDPDNVGRKEQWWRAPRQEAKKITVPWSIQGAFPGYRGVVWYWRDFVFPAKPHSEGRYLLRFWDVDYLADVWVNGLPVGRHEGAQAVFILDVTEAAKPGLSNQIAVRVLDPKDESFDGFVSAETPHGGWTGSPTRSGGILDSVELLIVPRVYIEDITACPDPTSETIRLKVTAHNAGPKPTNAEFLFTVAPAANGETLSVLELERNLPPGETCVEASLQIENPRRWDIDDPYLYRVSARVSTDGSESFDESSTRCGFREFKFENGYFRLNGRRIFLRCSHSGCDTPVGVRVPENPDLLRRDLVNSKTMGFNMIRFIAGLPRRFQLDLCDEIGLMVYEESYASWMLRDSPQMKERFDRSLTAMIRRDRNHPSIVMWGLLNETGDGPIFQHAVESLPLVRSLDNSRMVMLGSGRFDCVGNFLNGLNSWRSALGPEPNVTHNPKPYGICYVVLWPQGQVALHPGAHGEYSVVRWTAPEAGEYTIVANFEGTAPYTTTDVHILRDSSTIHRSFINLGGFGNESFYSGDVKVPAGSRIDFVVGWGGSFDYDGAMGSRWVDNTSLTATIRSKTGKIYDLSADLSSSQNPHGVWSYGYFPPGPKPDASSFTAYSLANTENHACTGGVSNPGSDRWEDVLSDQHYYPKVPHNKLVITRLRTIGGNDHNLFLSEYGVGSSVDLIRIARHYEQIGQTSCQTAKSFRTRLDAFMGDWQRWKLREAFVSPEDYFRQAVAKMAGQRTLGINALRANPLIVGYNLTGTSDPVGVGEGLTTAFRDLKPGAVDALFEVFQPLRWCLFVEPVNVYRNTPVRFEAVLANEDALPPGQYPIRLHVVDAKCRVIFERTLTITIGKDASEPAFSFPVFSEDLVIDSPPGKCRFMATFLEGGAATGGDVEFCVGDPAEMPAVEGEVILWSENANVFHWLTEHGIRVQKFSDLATPSQREVILVSALSTGGENAREWQQLARRIARGANAIFLSPDVFNKGKQSLGWLPLVDKGSLAMTSEYTFPSVYPKDEWLKRHPIFDGLPAPGFMDYTFWREIIPDIRYVPQETPDEALAGAIRTSLGYTSELMVAVYRLGAGRFIVNTLQVGQNLGKDPVAERLLRNMLRYAARETSEPLADLPGDFDSTLRRLGYFD